MSRWDRVALGFVGAAAVTWGLFIAYIWWWPSPHGLNETCTGTTWSGQQVTVSVGMWVNNLEGFENEAVCAGSGQWLPSSN